MFTRGLLLELQPLCRALRDRRLDYFRLGSHPHSLSSRGLAFPTRQGVCHAPMLRPPPLGLQPPFLPPTVPQLPTTVERGRLSRIEGCRNLRRLCLQHPLER
jgi:hypothetical protein